MCTTIKTWWVGGVLCDVVCCCAFLSSLPPSFPRPSLPPSLPSSFPPVPLVPSSLPPFFPPSRLLPFLRPSLPSSFLPSVLPPSLPSSLPPPPFVRSFLPSVLPPPFLSSSLPFFPLPSSFLASLLPPYLVPSVLPPSLPSSVPFLGQLLSLDYCLFLMWHIYFCYLLDIALRSAKYKRAEAKKNESTDQEGTNLKPCKILLSPS